jgi:hypothetical protein
MRVESKALPKIQPEGIFCLHVLMMGVQQTGKTLLLGYQASAQFGQHPILNPINL